MSFVVYGQSKSRWLKAILNRLKVEKGLGNMAKIAFQIPLTKQFSHFLPQKFHLKTAGGLVCSKPGGDTSEMRTVFRDRERIRAEGAGGDTSEMRTVFRVSKAMADISKVEIPVK